MIVDSIETLVKHIGINFNIDFSRMETHLKRAEYKFLIPLIGQAQYAAFTAQTPSTDTDVITAVEFAQGAVSNLAYYLALPEFAVQVTDGGIYETSGEHIAPASDKKFKELQRAKKTAGHEYLDRMISFMESKKDKFEAFTNDDSYKAYKKLLVYSTSKFQEYYNIFHSYQTFKALRPQMITVEDQFIKGPIQRDLLAALKADQTEANRIEVKELLQKSIVAFTIYKTVDNGMFVVSAEGIHLKFDQLPYEKVLTNLNLKINDFLLNTKRSKRNEGEEYLKQALNIIKENPTDFVEYTPLEETGTRKHGLIKTPGILGI